MKLFIVDIDNQFIRGEFEVKDVDYAKEMVRFLQKQDVLNDKYDYVVAEKFVDVSGMLVFYGG